ncbi:MAG: sodium:calcium antiporter [Candidatus Bathyarchaeota archaeon]|nr:sodium:calcium antiporter [Candidatus Bathyarchaeota archaeon]
MFEELGLIGNMAILIAALVALAKASETTITHALNVASVTRLGKTTVGFILVAFSTSLPEFFVAIFSTVNPENVGVSVGNVLGANISNICLILGSCFLLLALKNPRGSFLLPKMAKEEISSLHFGLFIASIVPLTLLYLHHVSRFIGIMLLAIFMFYMYKLSKGGAPETEAPSGAEKRKLGKYVALTFIGAIGVVACAFFIVESASNIAASIGLPAIIIGATIVSFGTTMPEFATSISAVRKGHLELALGNTVGSCFVNITLILGVTLTATSFSIDASGFSNVALFSLMANLLLWYFLSSGRIGWREAAILLFMYGLFIAISFGAL